MEQTAWRRLAEAARFWEPRRIIYNLVLVAFGLGWLTLTWPHFRPALTLVPLLQITVLALLANVCYCAAYLLDVPLLRSAAGSAWMRWRWMLWSAGMVFAILLENYWIADEIYPFVR